jgi:HSP20 family molecular chaperone IbpA
VGFAPVNPARLPIQADFQNDFAAMISQMQRIQQEMMAMTGGFSGIPIPSMDSLLGTLPGSDLQRSTRAGMPMLEDAGDRYVVRVSLPGQDLSKVNVNLRDRLLTIEARNENRGGSGGLSMTRDFQYSQAMNLPGPVLVGKMKVDRRGDELVVTLPKLGS